MPEALGSGGGTGVTVGYEHSMPFTAQRLHLGAPRLQRRLERAQALQDFRRRDCRIATIDEGK